MVRVSWSHDTYKCVMSHWFMSHMYSRVLVHSWSWRRMMVRVYEVIAHMNGSCHVKSSDYDTGRRRPIGSLKLQVSFRKKDTNYRALLRKMTYEDKASHGSLPLCTCVMELWCIWIGHDVSCHICSGVLDHNWRWRPVMVRVSWGPGTSIGHVTMSHITYIEQNCTTARVGDH